MAKIGALVLNVDTRGAAASFSSLAAAIEAVDGVTDKLCGAGFSSFVLGHDLSGLLRCEAVDSVAARAGELHGLRIVPDERYVELVAALTRDGNPYTSGFLHGWPILSVVGRTPTVAEAGGEAIAPGGGQIA